MHATIGGEPRSINSPLFNTTAWNAGMCFFPCLIPLLMFLLLILCCCKTPPVCKSFTPFFAGVKYFAPPTPKPMVACYFSLDFCKRFTLLPVILDGVNNVMFVDIYTPGGSFGSPAPYFRIRNIYFRALLPFFPSYTVGPATALADLDIPYLVAGDFNIHNLASDPFRVLSATEENASAPYYNRAAEVGFTLLNTPGLYTLHRLPGEQRPSTIDLAFANLHMFPAFVEWDATSLPSTGSDHVPIIIRLAPPLDAQMPPRPKWKDTDSASLKEPLNAYPVPPPPLIPSPKQLNDWSSSSLNALTALVKSSTSSSRPYPHSKP